MVMIITDELRRSGKLLVEYSFKTGFVHQSCVAWEDLTANLPSVERK